MGSCCSAPVSDSAQQDSARASIEEPPANKGRQDGHGGQGKGGRESGTGRNQKGRRTSVDWNKSILGCFSDVKEKYAFDKVLGKGQFGVTRLVVDLVTGEHCACKSISKRKLVSQEDMEDVRREIKVMHHLSGHPHVVTFKGGEEQGGVAPDQRFCCKSQQQVKPWDAFSSELAGSLICIRQRASPSASSTRNENPDPSVSTPADSDVLWLCLLAAIVCCCSLRGQPPHPHRDGALYWCAGTAEQPHQHHIACQHVPPQCAALQMYHDSCVCSSC